MIKFSGFADEAGSTIEEQIKATKELGWNNIDVRFINGVNLTDIDDEQFEVVCNALQTNNICVPCFGSAVGNSNKSTDKPEDVAYCFSALERALPRMKKLGTRMIRGMSFGLQSKLSIEENEEIIYPLMERIVSMCREWDVTFVCENCGGYAGSSPKNLLKLAEHFNSPYFKIAFDTGNPVGTRNMTGTPPYDMMKTWDFYKTVRKHIAYIHIKDQIIDADGKIVRTYPGDGDGDVKKVVKDLIASGYDGYVAIEPHLRNGYDGYVEYGRRTEALFASFR